MNKLHYCLATGLLTCVIAGCSSPPKRIDYLEDARAEVAQVDRDPMAEEVAGEELKQAKQALAQADLAVEDRAKSVEIQHYAYVASRHAEIAMERIEEARTRAEIADSEAERSAVLLNARTREAERAKALAEERSQELKQQELAAELAQDRADAAVAEAQLLQEQLEGLEAEETARGLVMTLSSGILFDTDQATLKPGAEISMDRLAAFLAEYPERNLIIEGHTDSQGTDEYNVSLSFERAEAVRVAMVQRGIDGNRIRSNGLGEAFPIATNESTAGRQLNRRVEIVISDEDGMFPPAAERTAYSQ